MVRSIVAVIVSYLIMFVLDFIAFTCAYLIVGPDVAFKPGIYEAATAWIGFAFVIQFVISIIGGLLCALIAKGGKAPFALAILAIVLGIGVALADMGKGKANAGLVRTGNTPQLEAVKNAYWPVWVPFVFPFTSGVAILIGAKMKRQKN